METLQAKQKYSLLLSLYLAQSIPMSFFSTVVPVIMRMENYSLASIGLLQLVKIPWILKFLWAPFIDRTASANHHYKRWIIGSEVFYASIIIAIGFFDLSSEFSTIIVLMIGAFIISATQDIASDALAVKILATNQRSYGNSMQSAGSFLGTLIGSGVLLYLYAVIGWRNLLFALAAFVLLALLPLRWIRKKPATRPVRKERQGLRSIGGFFKQKGIGRRVVLLFLIYSGLIGMLAMMKPFMVDLGYSVKKIAFIAGIFGTAFGAAGAILAGHLIHIWGKKKSMKRFAFYGASAALLMLLVSSSYTVPEWVIFVAVAMVWSAYSSASTVVYTISMETVRPGHEGTDYTLQIVISHLSGIIVAVGSGKLADIFGYQGLFTLEAGLGILFALLSGYLYREGKPVIKGKKVHPKNLQYLIKVHKQHFKEESEKTPVA